MASTTYLHKPLKNKALQKRHLYKEEKAIKRNKQSFVVISTGRGRKILIVNGGIQDSLYNKDITIHNCIINADNEYFKSLSYSSTTTIVFLKILFLLSSFVYHSVERIGTVFNVFVLLKFFPVKTFR